MKTSLDGLSVADRNAVLQSLIYWVNHWDEECPIIFGTTLDEMNSIVRQWPDIPARLEKVAVIAAVDSLRELLYGASSVSREDVERITGLSKEDAGNLCSRLRKTEEYE